MPNHPNRSKHRHGHLQGHIRDTFLRAFEAYEAAEPGQRPRVPYEIRYRERMISLAEACGLVWGCTDVLPGSEFRALCDMLGLNQYETKQTYAAAAHALLTELKAKSEVDAAGDARLKRLYDRRDALIDDVERMIILEQNLDPADQLDRQKAAIMADQAIESWQRRMPDASTPLEMLLQKTVQQGELIKAVLDQYQHA